MPSWSVASWLHPGGFPVALWPRPSPFPRPPPPGPLAQEVRRSWQPAGISLRAPLRLPLPPPGHAGPVRGHLRAPVQGGRPAPVPGASDGPAQRALLRHGGRGLPRHGFPAEAVRRRPLQVCVCQGGSHGGPPGGGRRTAQGAGRSTPPAPCPLLERWRHARAWTGVPLPAERALGQSSHRGAPRAAHSETLPKGT